MASLKLSGCHVDTLLINMYEGQLEPRSRPHIHAKVKAIPCTVIYGPHAPEEPGLQLANGPLSSPLLS